MIRLPVFVTVAAVAWASSLAYAQPSLSRAVPAALAPGKTTQVALHGAKLNGPLQIWNSLGASVEVVDNTSATHVVCKFTLPASAPPGFGCVIVGGAAGASDALILAVDDLPATVDNGKNHTPQSAQAVTWPIAIDGVCDSATSDYYQFEAKANQRLSVEVLAARLDSTMDPVLYLRTLDGRELRMSDDAAGLRADCRLEHVFAADGSYLLEVHDSRHKGGGPYRLRLGDFPLVGTPLPLGGRRGATSKVYFAVASETAASPVVTTFPDDPRQSTVGTSARVAGGKSSAIAPLILSDYPELIEREPNDDAPDVDNAPGIDDADAIADTLSLPCGMSGRFDRPGDVDRFSFVAAKGQPLRFRVAAGRLGSMAVPKLSVQAPNGRTLVATKFVQVGDPTLNFTPPEDGTYQLVATELLSRGGPTATYRIEMDRVPPFVLTLKNDKSTSLKYVLPRQGGTVSVDVVCQRNGYDGPIELAWDGASGGLELFNATIPAKAKSGKITIAAVRGSNPGDLRVGRLVGTADVGGRKFASPVSTAAVVTARRPRLYYPPDWLDGRLTFVVSNTVEKPPFDVTVEPLPVTFARPLRQASLVTLIHRQNKEFKEAVQLHVRGLPPEISATVAKVAADKKATDKAAAERFQVTLKGTATASVSQNPIRFVGLAAFKGKGYLVERTAMLEVLDPLSVQLAEPTPHNPGATVNVTVRLTRRGGDAQPVVVRWHNLPAGVVGPDSTTFNSDEDEKQIDLALAADVKPGELSLAVVATSTYQGQELQAQSSPVTLRVNQPK